MAKANSNIRALATAPLAPFKHERVTVPEWEDAKLVVRELVAGDWLDYRAELAKARQKAGVEPGEATDAPINVIPATALVLVRTLFTPDGKRALSDKDIPEVAASFSSVHGRLVDLAFKLSGVSLTKTQDGEEVPADPVEEAGKG